MVLRNIDFFDLQNKAEFLELCDDHEGAAELRAASLEIAREVDLICFGYLLIWRNRVRDAIEILERNAARHPGSWNAWDSLGDAFAHHGDVRRAIDCYSQASRLVDSDEESIRIERIIRELASLSALAS
jgi:hypothetical protein